MTASKHETRRFLSDHPGTPLGAGMPLGATFRQDGESHRSAWERLLRADPCSYCGARPAGTVDHVEPRARPVRGLGGCHVWLNLAGACPNCNTKKAARPLLAFLWARTTQKARLS